MRVKKLDNNTSEKFIEAMLESILEHGGLTGVNLRMVAKKVGCAHTNAYNYFDGYDGLIYAAYDRALIIYGQAVVKELDIIDSKIEYFSAFVKNIIEFALNYPGYYRFIGSDMFDLSGLAGSTIQKAIELKAFFLDVTYTSMEGIISREDSDRYANILMSYIDGELYNIINYRAFPDDQTESRIIKNCIHMVELFLKGDTLDPILTKRPVWPNYILEANKS